MRDIDLDDLLANSRPIVDPIATQQSIDSMIETTSAQAKRIRAARPLWKRPLVTFPILGVCALAITAGALVYSFGGNPDVVIPISYVTDSGRAVSCGYALHVGTEASTDADPLRKFVAEHDWSGIGPRVYLEAIAHPYVPTPAEAGELTADNIDRISFDLALNTVISDEYPPGLEPAGVSAAESNCTGELQ
ncbi:hypothetical protein [Cryobacterium zongtaii]|nr:hypothetical protein [Cryobacterium zongtaii]